MTLRRKSVSKAITCLFRFYPSYLGIIGIALDRSKWRSVISPKISIFF